MGGFIWRYGKGRKKIDASFYHKAKQAFSDLFSKTVTRYDLEGKKIKTYPSIKEAAKAVGSHPSVISNAMGGKYMTAKGFIWKSGKGEKKIDTAFYEKRKKQIAQIFSKKIVQYNLQGRRIKTYASIKDAAASIQCHAATISTAAHKKQKAKGFIWKFLNQ